MKTTLFRDTIIEKFGDAEKGLLVGVGAEIGYSLLDNLNSTHIETYDELIELRDWLIEEKGKEHDIKIVAFDVAEELIPIIEKEVIRQSVIDTKKPCKSINAAYGGFGSGQTKVIELIKDYFLELRKAGFGIWVIGHTRFKTIKEKGSLEEEGYMQLTSNLQGNYESAFGDIFDVTLTGYIDREIEEEVTGEGDNERKKRKATGEIRKLYFRGNTLIDAGGRFAMGAVPEYLVFDKPNMAKEFIHTVEEGMRLSKTGALNNVDVVVKQPTTPKVSVQTTQDENEFADFEEDINDLVPEVDTELNEKLRKKITTKFKTADTEVKKKIKDVLGGVKLADMENTKVLEDILIILG